MLSWSPQGQIGRHVSERRVPQPEIRQVSDMRDWAGIVYPHEGIDEFLLSNGGGYSGQWRGGLSQVFTPGDLVSDGLR